MRVLVSLFIVLCSFMAQAASSMEPTEVGLYTDALVESYTAFRKGWDNPSPPVSKNMMTQLSNTLDTAEQQLEATKKAESIIKPFSKSGDKSISVGASFLSIAYIGLEVQFQTLIQICEDGLNGNIEPGTFARRVDELKAKAPNDWEAFSKATGTAVMPLYMDMADLENVKPEDMNKPMHMQFRITENERRKFMTQVKTVLGKYATDPRAVDMGLYAISLTLHENYPPMP